MQGNWDEKVHMQKPEALAKILAGKGVSLWEVEAESAVDVIKYMLN